MLPQPATTEPRHFLLPPQPERANGQPRHVGVELEFVALEPREAGELTQALYGGTLKEISPFYFELHGSRLGDFRIELDSRHALREPRHAPNDPAAGWFDGLLDDLERELQYLYSVAVTGIIPLEIVTPPIPMRALSTLDPLVEALRDRGAKGTEHSLLYAFGMHLNPEAVVVEPGYILGVLRAYLLLEDWLRREVAPAFLRRALFFITPFDRDYARQVLEPGYDPARLIDDYLAANPTRYRSLDLLPLFCELDAARVQGKVSNGKVKARPTFHYRLPDFRTSDPQWSLATEWNRWVQVETLSADPALVAELAQAYLRHDERTGGAWADRIARQLAL
jgi:hypothetical protein